MERLRSAKALTEVDDVKREEEEEEEEEEGEEEGEEATELITRGEERELKGIGDGVKYVSGISSKRGGEEE
jgi:hypothetical protein